MKVHWTNVAERHLDSIYDFIARDSEMYAKRMVDRITARSIQIGSFPYSGRTVPEYERDDIRELFEDPYRVIYRVKLEQVDVIAVIHGERDIIGGENDHFTV